MALRHLRVLPYSLTNFTPKPKLSLPKKRVCFSASPTIIMASNARKVKKKANIRNKRNNPFPLFFFFLFVGYSLTVLLKSLGIGSDCQWHRAYGGRHHRRRASAFRRRRHRRLRRKPPHRSGSPRSQDRRRCCCLRRRRHRLRPRRSPCTSLSLSQ